MDCAIHRDARTGMARCLSAHRSRRDAGTGRDEPQARSSARRAMATVARLCSAPLVARKGRAQIEGNEMISSTHIETPLGPLVATAENGALTGLWFIGQRYFPRSTDGWTEDADAEPFAA